ncbi:MAG: AAA family ATPase, partial [Eggerthellaceae bacterium]|nr:AAA family ATPase [Eggerthellaceae bacterium]
MLPRDAYGMLLDWKEHSRGKALLVDGARQIGKTFLIEKFAQEEYPTYIKIDFLRDENAAAFSGATSADQVINMLSLVSGKRVDPGRTLVFFDEVQEAPNLVTFSKYLIQDGRFDIVMSGSLLGVEMRHVKSLPVGYLRAETMFPLTFREFCDALNVPGDVWDEVEGCFREPKAVNEGIHDNLIRLFRLYLVIGGMPEAVQVYLDTDGDLGAVRETQRQLVALYREDIAKHAGSRALQVKAIFDALPGQLAKENKRFQMKALK